MKVYISGISGTGMGPLALMAKAAGFDVCGSDLARGAIYEELIQNGIEVAIGEQTGEFLRKRLEENGVDWFVYTTALPKDHPELKLAQETGIKNTKRDDFTAFLVDELNLKMIAVAGTHGKTTTTAMIVWAALRLGLKASYIVGTTLGFAPSGMYHRGDRYFIYEADEYDRNFLKYHPWLAVIPAVSYDHPDIYPTQEDYDKAFLQFKQQSNSIIEYRDGKIFQQLSNDEYTNSSGIYRPEDFKLAGRVRRIDAALAANAVFDMQQDHFSHRGADVKYDHETLIKVLDDFPGVGRRFEKITERVYTDYAHHPEEIVATIGVAKEEARRIGAKGIVVVYQPHQNTRQHEVRAGYRDSFAGIDKLYWLPTYLTRENPDLPVLTPEVLISGLRDSTIAEPAQPNEDLARQLKDYLERGFLVVLMTAGPADQWLRDVVKKR